MSGVIKPLPKCPFVVLFKDNIFQNGSQLHCRILGLVALPWQCFWLVNLGVPEGYKADQLQRELLEWGDDNSCLNLRHFLKKDICNAGYPPSNLPCIENVFFKCFSVQSLQASELIWKAVVLLQKWSGAKPESKVQPLWTKTSFEGPSIWEIAFDI
jgi:hypothetical protein